MTKETVSFLIRLLIFTVLLFGIHFYILIQLFTGSLFFPIWAIYLFNGILVLLVYLVIIFKSRKGSAKIYQLFLGMTISKMVLSMVFLLPLFLGKSDHAQLEVINFFIPYFLFLGFEIFSLSKFLQKT